MLKGTSVTYLTTMSIPGQVEGVEEGSKRKRDESRIHGNKVTGGR